MSVITAPAVFRPRCYRCWRPVATCFCSELPTLPTRTRIVILQHPHERCHPFGTARLVALCLPQSRIHVAYKGLSGDLHCPVDVPRDAAVLFPHASASDLADLPVTERPTTLVVLDGTWAHSKRLWRENAWLQRLRHVRLRPVAPSRYRIRREPQADYVSTVEAVVQALRILEPATAGLDGLLAAFERMIDRQVEIVAQKERRGRAKSERMRVSRALSPLLLDPRLVVAYAESSLPGGRPTATRELVQWVAARVSTGEVFEALLRPGGEWPSPHHLAHMQLEPGTLAGGESLPEAGERFLAFAGPDAPIAAWTQSTLDWGSSVIGARPRTVLKTNYCNLRNHRASFLETVLQREHLTGIGNECHGRARERLGNALAVARWLREQWPRDGAARGRDRAPTAG
ncbi:MAG TPA: tRNA-uridine aminocarboxypropyltransferase [Planctomycetota bacterium]|nr:tRNA-uridine aminocarboxypropyltransferase [Planctomycetota bacterium]